MTTKVDYTELVGLDQKAILAKMKEGSLPVPLKGTDERKKFEEFCALDANSDQRQSYLSDTPPAGAVKDGTPPNANAGTPTDGENTPAGENLADGTPPPASGGAPIDNTPPPADEWGGHGSREKLLEAHGNMSESVESLTKQVRSLRSTDGKLGQRVKDQEKLLADKESELADMRKKITEGPAGANPPPPPADGTPPDRPKRPDPKDFEDGEADIGFVEARDAYEISNDQYVASLEGRLGNITGKVTEMEQKFTEVTGKVDSVASFASNQQKSAAEQAQTDSWDTMWDETRQVQTSMGFATSADIRTINDHWLASKSGTAQDKATSQKFLDALPETDLASFKKVAPIINAMYSFGDEGPQKRFANVQAALWSTDGPDGQPLANQYSDVIVPAQGMSPRHAANAAGAAKRNNNANQDGTPVSALPAGDLGGNDAPIDGQLTVDDKKIRLRELQAMRKKNIRGFDNDDKMVSEYRRLITELGGVTTLSR